MNQLQLKRLDYKSTIGESLLSQKWKILRPQSNCPYMGICNIDDLTQINTLDLSNDCPVLELKFLLNGTSYFSRIQSLFRYYDRRYDQGYYEDLLFYIENRHLPKYMLKTVISDTNYSSWFYSEPEFPKQISLTYGECMNFDIVLQFSIFRKFIS